MKKEGLKILLIEDSKTSAMITTNLLDSIDKRNYMVVAKSLEDGIKRLKDGKFDVILLDLTLPDSSGIETFIKIHDTCPDIPIIILSSSNDEKIVLKAIESGAQDYLFKEELTKSLLRKSILYTIERSKFVKTLNEKNRIIKENEKIFKEILQNYPDGIFLLDENKRIILTNKYGEKFFQKSENKIIGSEFDYPIPISESMEIEINISNNEKRIAEIMAKKIRFNKNNFFIVSLRDITEKKKLQEQLKFYATKDSLTGFYNRRYGLELIGQSIKVAKRKGEKITLCFIDIDNLKYANDTYGHPKGDELILTVTNGIKNIVRDSDIVVRLGGDEFLIAFLNADTSIAKSVMSRIEYKIYQIAKEKKFPFKVSISKGYSEFDPESEINLDKLISIADIEMYEEKSKKKKFK